MGLLGLFMAEDANMLDRSVLTPPEMDAVLSEAAALDPADPMNRQFVAKVNRAANNKQTVIPTDDLRIRAAYSLRAHMLPDNIRRAVAAGAIKIVNNAFYKVFDFSGLKQNDLMLNADTKLAGVTNVNSRKLEENNFFLLTAIILQTGKFTDKPHDAEFGIPCREILNGEFLLKNGDKVPVQPSSARIFDTSTRNSVIRGEWKLDNPKFIAPQVEIIPEPALPVAAPDNTTAQPEVDRGLPAEGIYFPDHFCNLRSFLSYNVAVKVKIEHIVSMDRVHASVRCVHASVRRVHGNVRCIHGNVRRVHASVRRVHGNVRCIHGNVRRVHASVRCVHENVRRVHASVRCVHENVRRVHVSVRCVHERVRRVHENVRCVHGNARRVHENASVQKINISTVNFISYLLKPNYYDR